MSTQESRAPTGSPVRLRRDVDGCGCIRCQRVDHTSLSPSLSEGLLWSVRLPIDRPSIVLLFALVALLQVGLLAGPAMWMTASALVGVIGAFVVRGYIGVIGRESLAGRDVSPQTALSFVARRLPAFLAAAVVVGASLGAAVYVLTRLVVGPARSVADVAGAEPLIADVTVLLATAGLLLGVLIKLCFVPEACFVGGYGPIRSLRASWQLTRVHPRKAAAITVGLGVLLAIGLALDTQIADPRSPVVLTFRYGEHTIPLRSFGVSRASGLRAGVDLVITTAYSGVFVHQYVSGIFYQAAS